MHVCLQLLVHLLVASIGTALFVLAVDLWLRIGGIVLITAGNMGIGTNTHTSSHYSTSNKRWINEALTVFGYPVCFGLSATYWWHKHVFRHHSSPNMVGIDGDGDLWPWFATAFDESRELKGCRRLYYRHLQVF